jgi:hypothetical protein
MGLPNFCKDAVKVLGNKSEIIDRKIRHVRVDWIAVPESRENSGKADSP